MRIVGIPDDAVGRHDRALWLEPEFDLQWDLIVTVVIGRVRLEVDSRLGALVTVNGRMGALSVEVNDAAL